MLRPIGREASLRPFARSLAAMSLFAGSAAIGPPADLVAQEVGPAAGSLVIAGGGLSDPEVVTRFIDLAGGPDAPIVVIPTAGGGEDGDYGEHCSCTRLLRDNGARNLTVLHTYDPAVADTEPFAGPLAEARGVWFPGGRQWRLVDAYAGTRTERALRAVLDRGGVIGGTSAGASIQGSFLVRGDSRTNTIMMGDHQAGFGYLRGVAIDQHLLRRNRQFDLLEVIEAHPELLGIGIDENTAIVVEGDHFEVMGQGYAAIYDHGATLDGGGRFYFLAPGDRFDLATRTASRPARSFQELERVQRRGWSQQGGGDGRGDAREGGGTGGADGDAAQEARAAPGPVIEPWGATYEVRGLEAAAPLDLDYRVLFDVSQSTDDPRSDGVNPHLNTVARFVNLHARAGVPQERTHVALVVHGTAGEDLLDDAAYRARYGRDNPNGGLVRALVAAGVDIQLCGQTAMARGLPGDELLSGVTMALSAMTARVALQARGYQEVN